MSSIDARLQAIETSIQANKKKLETKKECSVQWDKIPKGEEAKFYQVTKVRIVAADLFLKLAPLPASLAAVMGFSANPVIATAVISIASLALLTLALVMTSIALKKMQESPMDPEVRKEVRKQAQSDFAKGTLFTNDAYSTVLNSAEIQELFRFEIEQNSYLDFTKKYSRLLSTLNDDNKDYLRLKFVAYLQETNKGLLDAQSQVAYFGDKLEKDLVGLDTLALSKGQITYGDFVKRHGHDALPMKDYGTLIEQKFKEYVYNNSEGKTADQLEKEFAADFSIFSTQVKKEVFVEIFLREPSVKVTPGSDAWQKERREFVQKSLADYQIIPKKELKKRLEFLQNLDRKEALYQKEIHGFAEAYFKQEMDKDLNFDQVQKDYDRITGTAEFRQKLSVLRWELVSNTLMALDGVQGLRFSKGYIELVGREQHNLKVEEEQFIEAQLIEFFKVERNGDQAKIVAVMEHFHKLKKHNLESSFVEILEAIRTKKTLELAIVDSKKKIDAAGPKIELLQQSLYELDLLQTNLFNLLRVYEEYFPLSLQNELLRQNDEIKACKEKVKEVAAKSPKPVLSPELVARIAKATEEKPPVSPVKPKMKELDTPAFLIMKTYKVFDPNYSGLLPNIRSIAYIDQGKMEYKNDSLFSKWDEPFYLGVEALPDFFQQEWDNLVKRYPVELNLGDLQSFIKALEAVNSHLDYEKYPRISATHGKVNQKIGVYKAFLLAEMDKSIEKRDAFALMKLKSMQEFPHEYVEGLFKVEYGDRLTKFVLATYLNPNTFYISRKELERLLVAIAVDVRAEDVAAFIKRPLADLTQKELQMGLKHFRPKNLLELFEVALTFDKREIGSSYIYSLPKKTEAEKKGVAAFNALADMESYPLWQGPRQASIPLKEVLNKLNGLLKNLEGVALGDDPYYEIVDYATAASSLIYYYQQDPTLKELVEQTAVAFEWLQVNSFEIYTPFELYPASKTHASILSPTAAIYGKLWGSLAATLRTSLTVKELDLSLSARSVQDPFNKTKVVHTEKARAHEFVGRKISYLLGRYYVDQELDTLESIRHLAGTLFTNTDGFVYKIAKVVIRPDHGYVLQICVPLNPKAIPAEKNVPVLLLFQGAVDNAALRRRDEGEDSFWKACGEEVFDAPLKAIFEEFRLQNIGTTKGRGVEFILAGHDLGADDAQNASLRIPEILKTDDNYQIQIYQFNAAGATEPTLKFENTFGFNSPHSKHLRSVVKTAVEGDSVSRPNVEKGSDKVTHLQMTPTKNNFKRYHEKHNVFTHANTTPLYPLTDLERSHFSEKDTGVRLPRLILNRFQRSSTRMVPDRVISDFRQTMDIFLEPDELRLGNLLSQRELAKHRKLKIDSEAEKKTLEVLIQTLEASGVEEKYREAKANVEKTTSPSKQLPDAFNEAELTYEPLLKARENLRLCESKILQTNRDLSHLEISIAKREALIKSLARKDLRLMRVRQNLPWVGPNTGDYFAEKPLESTRYIEKMVAGTRK